MRSCDIPGTEAVPVAAAAFPGRRSALVFLPAAAVFSCEPVHSQYVWHMCEASQLSWSIGSSTGNLLCPPRHVCTTSKSIEQ